MKITVIDHERREMKSRLCPGLKITAGQRTMSGLIEALTGQTFDLPVMLTKIEYKKIVKIYKQSVLFT